VPSIWPVTWVSRPLSEPVPTRCGRATSARRETGSSAGSWSSRLPEPLAVRAHSAPGAEVSNAARGARLGAWRWLAGSRKSSTRPRAARGLPARLGLVVDPPPRAPSKNYAIASRLCQLWGRSQPLPGAVFTCRNRELSCIFCELFCELKRRRRGGICPVFDRGARACRATSIEFYLPLSSDFFSHTSWTVFEGRQPSGAQRHEGCTPPFASRLSRPRLELIAAFPKGRHSGSHRNSWRADRVRGLTSELRGVLAIRDP